MTNSLTQHVYKPYSSTGYCQVEGCTDPYNIDGTHLDNYEGMTDWEIESLKKTIKELNG